ncbi:hypothetical protein [Nocardia sp. NPDC051981]|uniref:hypothetical protein n=1 Tax=Nocardia sp. NPDC051981 TaxID=3155417 RepID=UPI0034235530
MSPLLGEVVEPGFHLTDEADFFDQIRHPHIEGIVDRPESPAVDLDELGSAHSASNDVMPVLALILAAPG